MQDNVAKRRILGLRERKEGKRLYNEQLDNFCSSPSVIEKPGIMTGWITEEFRLDSRKE